MSSGLLACAALHGSFRDLCGSSRARRGSGQGAEFQVAGEGRQCRMASRPTEARQGDRKQCGQLGSHLRCQRGMHSHSKGFYVDESIKVPRKCMHLARHDSGPSSRSTFSVLLAVSFGDPLVVALISPCNRATVQSRLQRKRLK
jgi:hypothetical protein